MRISDWSSDVCSSDLPVSLVYRKGFVRDGKAALLQYGYGSYGSSMDPRFNASVLSLLDRGMVYAIAHVRGGQEMGRSWYEDGKLLNKKNTFTDFIDVTNYLVRNQYAAADRSEEHTSELQSLMRISYAVFCFTKKKINRRQRLFDLKTKRKVNEYKYSYTLS